MEDSKYKWSMLLKKFVDGEISQEELDELHRQMDASALNRKQFEEVTNPDYFKESIQEFQNGNIEKQWQALTKKMPDLKPSRLVRLIRSKNLKLYLAAACTLVVLALTAYLFISKKNLNNHLPSIAQNAFKEPSIKSYSYIKLSTGQEFKLEDLTSPILYDSAGVKISKNDTLISLSEVQGNKINNETLFYLVTAPQKQEKLLLPDGSLIMVDAATKLWGKLYFMENERRVKIYGQAFCEVKTKHNSSFTVQLGDEVEVSVLGTKFNVRNYKNENPTVTLISGKVQLSRGNDTFQMREGQKVEFTKGKKFKLNKGSDVNEEIAWTEQVFSFENKNIFEMMNRIGAFFNYQVKFKDSTLTDKKASGRIPIDGNLKYVISAIEEQYEVKIEVKNDTLIVSRK